MIFYEPNEPIGRVQFFLNTKKNGALPLDLACLDCLNFIVAIQFATNEQLKYLTHMLCF